MSYNAHAKNIRRMRLNQKLSRDELARLAGISSHTITKTEQGLQVGIGAIVRTYTVLRPQTTVKEIVDGLSR